MQNLTIKKDAHYERLFPFRTRPFFTQTVWQGCFCFHETCEYDFPKLTPQQQIELGDWDHMGDVNKHFGVSLGLFNGNHADTAARWGWRWSKSAAAVELLAYTYANGVKGWDEQLRFLVVDTVQKNEWVGWKIERLNQGWAFTIYHIDENNLRRARSLGVPEHLWYKPDFQRPRGHVVVYHEHLHREAKAGWTQGFYFGGPLAALHDTHSSLILL